MLAPGESAVGRGGSEPAYKNTAPLRELPGAYALKSRQIRSYSAKVGPRADRVGPSPTYLWNLQSTNYPSSAWQPTC